MVETFKKYEWCSKFTHIGINKARIENVRSSCSYTLVEQTTFEVSSMFRSSYLSERSVDSMETTDEKAQYNVFEDYLGLIKLVCPSRCPPSMKSTSCESLLSSSLFDFPPERHRINSLDSDSLSDSSSSSGSRDLDMIYDSLSSNGDFPSYSNVPSPSMPTINEPVIPVYNSTLESLLACQKSVMSRLQPVAKVSKSSKNTNKATVCVFCRNNGESREFYSSHTLKDGEGNTACPILRAYTCPLCRANGDNSHTIKYCPKYTPKLKAEKLLSVGLSM